MSHRNFATSLFIGTLILLPTVCEAAEKPTVRSYRLSPPTVNFEVPEATHEEAGRVRAEWNYSFRRGNHQQRIFNGDQSLTGTRSQHRKTHDVTWRLKYGVTDRVQAEIDTDYRAYRQHTHSDGDEHDRNDDGDFDSVVAGLSYQVSREGEHTPALRVRAGAILPTRAKSEAIGLEEGFDLLAVAGKELGPVRLTGSLGFAMSFDNVDFPRDPDFLETQESKGHDLRAFRYGLGMARPIGRKWQANLELQGEVFDTIELNQREHESELTLTPGVLYHKQYKFADAWLGLGFPIGLTSDSNHLGVSVRTGVRF